MEWQEVLRRARHADLARWSPAVHANALQWADGVPGGRVALATALASNATLGGTQLRLLLSSPDLASVLADRLADRSLLLRDCGPQWEAAWRGKY